MIVRELFARLGLSVDAASFAVANQMLGVVRAGLGSLVNVAVRAGEGLTEVITKTVETASALNDTSSALGLTTDALQELGYAAAQNGSSAEGMTDGLRKLSINLQTAAEGGAEAAQAFARLGVSVTQGGKLRAVDDVLGDIAERFKNMPDGARKVALAVDLFGRSGASLIPTLKEGREGLAKWRKEARELGIVLDADVIAAGDELGDSWTKLQMAALGLKFAIAGPLLGSINESVTAMIAWVKANRTLLAQRLQVVFGALGTTIKVLARGLLVVGRAIGFVIDRWEVFAVLIISTLAAIALSNAAAVASFIALQVSAVGAAMASAAAWAAAAAPVALIAAAVAFVLLVLEDIYVFLKGGRSLIGDVGVEFARLLEKFLAAGPREGEHWMVKILRSTLIYLRAVGQYWIWIFGKIFDGVSWIAGKVEGLIGRLEQLSSMLGQKLSGSAFGGIMKRTGERAVGAFDKTGAAIGGALEGITQRFFVSPQTPTMPIMSSMPPMQSKSITATYAPTIVQQPGQSGQEVAAESQRLWSEWMSSEVENASAAVGTK